MSGYANAITVNFDFTGECDDCAFAGNPGDPGFNPLNDGLTETVSGSLQIDGLSVNNGMIEYQGAGTALFTYNSSSLINSFTMGISPITSPFRTTFSNGLLTSGDVADGSEFTFFSAYNFSDPNNPQIQNFDNFCTALGVQMFGSFNCIGAEITFRLHGDGDWSIENFAPFDIGGSGQFSESDSASAVPLPGAVVMFASGLIGLASVTRKKIISNS